MTGNQGKPSAWRSTENILNLAKILAILGAAIWSIFLFLRFERTERDLSLELLRSQNLQNELTSELQKLQIKKSEIEIAQSEATQLTFEQKINVTDLGPITKNDQHLFIVEHSYTITNIGNSSHEVTYVVIKAYKATLHIPGDSTAIEITSFTDKEGLSWDSIFLKGHYSSDKWSHELGFKNDKGEKILFKKGGGGTAELDPGEISKGTLELAIIGRPNDLIGFETRIGIDGGEESSNRWNLKNKTLLTVEDERSDAGNS